VHTQLTYPRQLPCLPGLFILLSSACPSMKCHKPLPDFNPGKPYLPAGVLFEQWKSRKCQMSAIRKGLALACLPVAVALTVVWIGFLGYELFRLTEVVF
jgi:hypothetical protein